MTKKFKFLSVLALVLILPLTLLGVGCIGNESKTDAEIITIFEEICDEYANGERTFTMSYSASDVKVVISFNSSTKEYVIIPAIEGQGVKFVKDGLNKEGPNYKYYSKASQKYNIILEAEVDDYVEECLGTFAELGGLVDSGIDEVEEISTDKYKITFSSQYGNNEVVFNEYRIMSLKTPEVNMTILDTFDLVTFNEFNTTGYTEATN